MELTLSVIVAVVVAVIILLIIVAFAFFVKDAGKQAIDAITNLPELIKTILKGSMPKVGGAQ